MEKFSGLAGALRVGGRGAGAVTCGTAWLVAAVVATSTEVEEPGRAGISISSSFISVQTSAKVGNGHYRLRREDM
jgi:hypothetical protein